MISLKKSILIAMTAAFAGGGITAPVYGSNLLFKHPLIGLVGAGENADSGNSEDDPVQPSEPSEGEGPEDDPVAGNGTCQIPLGYEEVVTENGTYYAQGDFQFSENEWPMRDGIGSQKLCDLDLHVSLEMSQDYDYNEILLHADPVAKFYPHNGDGSLVEAITVTSVTLKDSTGADIISHNVSLADNGYDDWIKLKFVTLPVPPFEEFATLAGQAKSMEVTYQVDDYQPSEPAERPDGYADECYDPANVGLVGEPGWTGCEGLWIVDNQLIRLSADLVADYGDEEPIGEEPVFGAGDGLDGPVVGGDNGGSYGGETYPPDQVFTGQVTSMAGLFDARGCVDSAGCPMGYNVPDISYWEVSSVRDFNNMFGFASLNASLDNWNTGSAKDMSGMFSYAEFLKPNNLSGWNVSNVLYMDKMFSRSILDNVSIGRDWDVSNVVSMHYMFDSAERTGSYYDFSRWNTSNVQNMGGMFRYSLGIVNSTIANWDVSSVVDMSEMFQATSVSSLSGISQWDVSSVVDMEKMFGGSVGLTADLSSWDVSSVNNMSNMFWWARGFNSDISGWDVSNVTDMSYMFASTDVFNIPLNEWDVSNVRNFNWMFARSQSFDQPLSDWDLSNATSMENMFREVEAFNQDLSGWCVPDIKFSPYRFDHNAYSWTMPNSRPVWGTCGPGVSPSPNP
jgi:surface protein